MTRASPNVIYITATNGSGEVIISGSRTTYEPHADDLLIYRALEFKYAARRDGRVFVCELIPAWKARILRLLRIKIKADH